MTFMNLIPPTYYNIKQYGPSTLGDGVTDATSAIQAAVTAATASGGFIFGPAGTYIYSSDITIPSNVGVLGVGPATIFQAANNCQANCFNASGSSHVTFANFQINGNKAGVTQLGTQYTKLNGIYLHNSDDITVMNCYIHDCYVSGVMANGGSTNIAVQRCRMVANYDNQIYIRAQDTAPYTPCSSIAITDGNICSGGSFSGIQVLGSSYFAITGNTCYSNGPTSAQGDGIGSEGASYGTITGNTVYSNGIQGINIRFTSETGGSQSSGHIVVADNISYSHTSTNGDAGGICVGDADDVEVTGNLVYGNAFGINLNGGNGNGVTNCTLADNQVRGNTNLGIRIIPGAGSSEVFLNNNTVKDNANDNLLVNGVRVLVDGGIYAKATGTHSGIHLQTGSDSSIIKNVDVYGNTDNGIVIDSPVTGVHLRNCTAIEVGTAVQNRFLQEQAGAGPTYVTNCKIVNQKTNRYVFNNTQSLFTDELAPTPQINTMSSILYYDGSSTYVTVPDASNLDMTAAVSIELWYNPLPTQNAFCTLLGKNSQYMLEGSGTGTDLKWQFFTNVNGSDRGSGLMNTALTPGRMNYLAFTYDSSTQQQKIYLNGVLDFTHTLTALGTYVLGTSANVLYIGTRQGFTTTRGAKGQMGEVRVWGGSAALSAADVTNHYAAKEDVSTTTTAALISRWKSNDGSGTSLADSASTNTGTIVGTAGWNFPVSLYGERPILATGASHTADDIITALQNLGIVRQS